MKKHNKSPLKIFLERVYVANEIPISVFRVNKTLFIQTNDIPFEANVFLSDQLLVHDLLSKCICNEYPILEIEDDIFIYGCFLDNVKNFYICGPIALEAPSISKLHYYRKRHSIKDNEFQIPQSSYIKLANVMAFIYWYCTGKELKEDKVLLQNNAKDPELVISERDMQLYRFEKAEYDREHVRYQYEQNYFVAIEHGDIEYINGAFSNEPHIMEKIGKFSNDSRKQTEYMCVSAITLMCRAAIRGGLNTNKAYEAADLYLQKLAKCKSVLEILQLYQEMRMDFVIQVKEHKEKNKHDYIEKCKDYISQRVHYPICVKEVAEVLGVSHSHLSRIFSKHEGMTIIQYSIKARLRAAANMLKYSNKSITEIANYFCFASQSRFGSQFKAEFGVTPKIYRKKHKVNDF